MPAAGRAEELSASALAHAQTFADGLQITAKDTRQRLKAELGDAYDSVAKKVEDGIADDRRGKVDKFIKQLAEQRAELAKISSEADELVSLCPSPEALLMHETLGSTKSLGYQTQLQGAGPVQLYQSAKLAIARGDREMAAAVARAVQMLPDRERKFLRENMFVVPDANRDPEGFSPASLADCVVGKRQREIFLLHAAHSQLALD